MAFFPVVQLSPSMVHLITVAMPPPFCENFLRDPTHSGRLILIFTLLLFVRVFAGLVYAGLVFPAGDFFSMATKSRRPSLSGVTHAPHFGGRPAIYLRLALVAGMI